MTDTATLDLVRPTRTPEFAKRIEQRYKSERRFRALGLGAIIFSVAVLIFLLGNMLMNGVGGFQRAELAVPINFAESGLAGDPQSLSSPTALQALEMQGLPDIVEFAAERELGEAGAA
ncbi:MAG: DUF3333 domain-containing protein, partial [Pseudomonadota bacterium]